MFSDDDLDESVKLVQRGFYVEPLTRRIDLDTVPLDGSEFIHKSRLEDAKLSFALSEDLVSKPSEEDQTKSMKQWGRTKALEFSRYALKLKTDRTVLIAKFPKKISFPQCDEIEWCMFCLGSKVCCTIYDDSVSSKGLVKGHLPFLSIVIHLSQKDIKMLLQYLYQWFLIIGMEEALGRWVYALLACLTKPLDCKSEKFLETFFNECRKRLKTCEQSEKFRLHLISALLEHYFCVAAYKVGSSLERFF